MGDCAITSAISRDNTFHVVPNHVVTYPYGHRVES